MKGIVEWIEHVQKFGKGPRIESNQKYLEIFQ
jgi:hypothetical protein